MDAINKLIDEGITVNIEIPNKTWIGLALAIAVPGILLIVTKAAMGKL